MQIVLNGRKYDVQLAQNICEFIRELKLVPETILVELNGLAPHRSKWPEKLLNSSDVIEILRVTAGG